MPGFPDPCDQFIKEFQAYLETLTSIQIDPRLRDWLAAEQSTPSGQLIEHERRLRVLEALSQLPEHEREALILQQ